MSDPNTDIRRRGAWQGRLLAVALLGLLLAGLAGCGDDEGGSNEADGGGGDGDNTEDTVAEETATDLLGPEDAATGEPVRIGLVSDGATQAFDNSDELRAGEATAEFYNERRGGIGGRPIEIVSCETGGTPDGATDCANQLIEQDVLAVALSQSAVTNLLWEQLHAAGVPTWFTQSNGEEIEADPSSFMVFNPDATFFGLPAAVAEENDVTKIAFIVIDVPQAVEIIENGGGQLLTDAGFEYEIVRVAIGTADMTSQAQSVADSGAGVVQIIGNDAFCIAAFQGLQAVAYEGQITAISQCLTDATREAMPGGLEGINVMSTLALGAADDPTYELYQAVMTEYGDEVGDFDNLTSMGGYAAVASLATALADIDGADITRESLVAAIKAMPESEYPGGGGIMYRCNGEAMAESPAICTNQWLKTTLDADGEPTTYTVEDSTSLLG